MKTFVIYNPLAGGIRSHPGRLQQAVTELKHQGHQIELQPTEGPNLGGSLARRCIDLGAELILVAGGDGTLNEVLNGMVGCGIPLGVLPGGTANVFATETRLGGNMVHVARQLDRCSPVPVALGRLTCGGAFRHFLSMAGAGLDARIVREITPAMKRRFGKVSYWISGFSQLGSRLQEFDVRFNGRTVRSSFALISRVKNYGGDLEIATHADLRDDRFAIVLFSGASSIPYLKYFSGVLFHSLRGMKGVTIDYSRSVEVLPLDSTPVPIQVDGEDAGDAPALLELIPNAIPLMLPDGRKAGER